METKPKYVPISCSFYDYLEAWATKRTLVKVLFRNEESHTQETEAYIDDLLNEKGEEFALFSNGLKIRLDRLIRINDIPLRLSC